MTRTRILDDEARLRGHWELSDRHRTHWGVVPMTDIDHLVALEYDRETPVAIIEYKYHSASAAPTSNTRTLATLGRMAGLPVYTVHYDPTDPQLWQFAIRQIEPASEHVWRIDEKRWTRWLHELRGRTT